MTDVKKRKRGKRAGVLTRFRRRAFRPPLPSLILSNVRKLGNKTDEFFNLMETTRDFQDCSAFCFTETWLDPTTPDSAIQPPGFRVFRNDRSPELSNKSGGGGACLMINERWCGDISVISSFCSPDLESLFVKCRPFYSPREFSSVVLAAVYIHPKADAEVALSKLAEQVTTVENLNPDSIVLVLGDFNHTKLSTVLPRYKQQVKCRTRGKNTLDHCYCTLSGAYRSIPRAPLGRSDHGMILLLPAYKQKLKTVKPVVRTVKKWTSDAVDSLRACLDSTDWSVFEEACSTPDELTDTITSYIGFCEEVHIPTRTVKKFANDKPWFSSKIKDKIKAKETAFQKGNRELFKRAKYELEREIRRAKAQYGKKLEKQFAANDSRAVWQSMQSITNYKPKLNVPNEDSSLPDQLNHFFARFDRRNSASTDAAPNTAPTATTQPSPQQTERTPPLTIQEDDVRRMLSKQNIRKASGPDGISSPMAKYCADQLAPILTNIFNLSLQQSKVPLCFKSSVIIPVPKKSKISSLNDYRPVALTSVAMKVFERLVLKYLKSVTDSRLDPLQFAYRANRSVDDAVSLALHNVLNHLETSNTYARILFIDFSSAFNTIVPSQLFQKLTQLHIDRDMCYWFLDFLLNRKQIVRMNGRTSAALTLNTGAPQGCVLSPLLFTLFTNDCRSADSSVFIIKFSDDTTIQGLISDGDEATYREEVYRAVHWCDNNNLELNILKTKEMIVDFRRNKTRIEPLTIKGQEVEMVDSFKFLGCTISDTLRWERNITAINKKAHQRLFFLRQLRKYRVNNNIMRLFYRSAIESVLTFSITVWFGNSTQQEKNMLQRIIKAAASIVGENLPSLDSIYSERLQRRAIAIWSDPLHPAHHLFQLLPSGRRLRFIKARTNRLKNSFYPKAVQTLSSQLPKIAE